MLREEVIKRLSEKGQNPEVYNFMVKGLKKGMSFKQIIYELREKGLAYRNNIMRRDLRIIAAELEKFEYLKRVKKTTKLDESFFKKLKHPTAKKFNITFKVEVYNLTREAEEVRYYTVGTDEYKKLIDYIEHLYYILDKGGAYYEELIIKKITPVRAFGWWNDENYSKENTTYIEVK